MSDPHPQQPGSDEADPEKMTTPIGVAHDLEEMADDLEATTGPEAPDGGQPATPPGGAPPTEGPR